MKKLLLALAALSLGCSSYDLTTPTQDALTGSWNLLSVNGTSLPYAPPHPGSNMQEVVADVLTLTAQNTFSEVTTIRITQDGQVTTQTVLDSGTYDFNSYVVTFDFKDGSIGSGTLKGRKMTIITSGISFDYEKQR